MAGDHASVPTVMARDSMTNPKILSNPYSTGGGGGQFETAVQACFVTLMLTGGYAPCLVPWPVVEVKLQGKIEGFETDDLIVYVEDPVTKERRRLLGQVKHSVSITAKDAVMGEVIAAAWADFNNDDLFAKGRDAIALITGPMSAVDHRNVGFLLNQARSAKDAAEFYRNVRTARFSPTKAEEKLAAIETHLTSANGGAALSEEQVFEFLRHFHVVGYDLDNDAGVSLSLLHSHMAQFDMELPHWAWARVLQVVQSANRSAGTLTRAALPEDLLTRFVRQPATVFPKELEASDEPKAVDWARHPDASYLARASLIGSWDEKNEADIREISKYLRLDHTEWLKKASDILQAPNSPLSIQDGRWIVLNRASIWSALGPRLMDQDLAAFKNLAVHVLSESDPAFELPPEQRYAAAIHGKVTSHSLGMRKGVAEGLALLGTSPDAASNCSLGNAELTASSAIAELFADADWVLWGSLDSLLPVLAEAAPKPYLEAVEAALAATPCPFDALFAQEGTGITGSNYLTGLLWSLEGLAWSPQLLVRVVVILGELAAHDPGGNWTNRPSNSMATIVLPWLPQTLATADKRLAAVKTVLREQPQIGWRLILQLLPGRQTISTGTHRPHWLKTIPDGWENRVSKKEYQEQVSAYADLAIEAAGEDVHRLAELAARLGDLPKAAFASYVQRLASPAVANIPEAQRKQIWNALTKFARKHRRFPDAPWSLPAEQVDLVEVAAQALAPSRPFELHQYLFNENESDLFEERGNYESQRKVLEVKRVKAVADVLTESDASGVVRFAEAVAHPGKVGFALGAMNDISLDEFLLPALLADAAGKRRQLAAGYICHRFEMMGWAWCDQLLSRNWALLEKARLLSELPFDEPTWSRATDALGIDEHLYWSEVKVTPYQTKGDIGIAVSKLLEVNRPNAAVECLAAAQHNNSPLSTTQVIQALLAGVSSSELADHVDHHNVTELIKFLQADPDVSEDDLSLVEWAYLQLLGPHDEVQPISLERRLATRPDFFTDIIKALYRSRDQDNEDEEPTELVKAIARNAWSLLNDWSMPPGIQADGSFSAEALEDWLAEARRLCTESGRLEVAMIHVGKVLIHVPADSAGLWINSSVAEILNNREAEELRDGFCTALFNSRGIHSVDPTGAPERALAHEYRERADAVENAGFQRFAARLRELADGYDQDAARIVRSNERDKRTT
jgi:hypothetical protein